MDRVEPGQAFRRAACRSRELSPHPAYRSAERGSFDVLSEPTKAKPDPRMVAWLRTNEQDIAVDPVILGELRLGILILPRGRKRAALERWFDASVGRLHCVRRDAETGLKWAELLAHLRTAGKAMTIRDSLIATTAVVHGLAVVTRNRVDFVNVAVRLVDPFVD